MLYKVARVYLLHAEAEYENGNEAAAKTSLKAIADRGAIQAILMF